VLPDYDLTVGDPIVVMSAAFALLVVISVCLLFSAVVYRSHRKSRGADHGMPARAGASWQAGRWDTDARHAYVANVGDDVAYELTVTSPQSERVIRTVERVPPYSGARLESTSDLPCYVSFSLDNRAKQPQHAVAGGSAVDPRNMRWLSVCAGGPNKDIGPPRSCVPAKPRVDGTSPVQQRSILSRSRFHDGSGSATTKHPSGLCTDESNTTEANMRLYR